MLFRSVPVAVNVNGNPAQILVSGVTVNVPVATLMVTVWTLLQAFAPVSETVTLYAPVAAGVTRGAPNVLVKPLGPVQL